MCKNTARMLVLLLAALCGAVSVAAETADSPEEEYYYYDVDENIRNNLDNACDDQRPPKIAINANMPVNQDNYEKAYGEDLTLYCSSEDSANLGIKHNDKPVKFNVLNSTTIELYVKKPDVDYYTYSCVDLNNGCEDEYALTIEIVPEMTVISSRVQHKVSDGWHDYFVPLGEDYEVFCSGNDVTNLRIEDKENVLETKIFNKSTIQHVAHADRVENKEFYCIGKGSNSDDVIKMITVTEDYYPDSEQFWCSIISWSTLQCFWSYLGDVDRFKLFYTIHNEETILCDERAGAPNDTCEWNIDLESYRSLYINNKEMLLTLVVCTQFVCSNRTYSMNTNAITILNPVSHLTVVSTSASDALLEWSSRVWGRSPETPEYWGHVACETCFYKVEYRMASFGEEWRRGNTSTVRCDWRVCKFKLPLPFPSSQFEVRVFVRFQEAGDDRLWSEPQLVVADTLEKEECECTTQAEGTSTETASCELCTLADYTISESLALKHKIKYSLKEKLAKIKELSALLSKKQEITDKINNLQSTT